MQTLILNGSPKTNGDTTALIDELTTHLEGEIKTISIRNSISSCVDCRYCWNNIGCTVNDEMQEVYKFLETCDNIVFASPIWYSSLSGPMLNLASRIQSIWAAGYFQNKPIPLKEKQGVLIIVGAQPKTKHIPTQTALSIMKNFGVNQSTIIKIYSLNTDKLPAWLDETALKHCREAARLLNFNGSG